MIFLFSASITSSECIYYHMIVTHATDNNVLKDLVGGRRTTLNITLQPCDPAGRPSTTSLGGLQSISKRGDEFLAVLDPLLFSALIYCSYKSVIILSTCNHTAEL
jgi:hypothetical protein